MIKQYDTENTLQVYVPNILPKFLELEMLLMSYFVY